ncbi:MAG TPA: PA2778 family cysteine peptidase [Pseudomonadales bacterium]|nr:PA2778 family cysteine peptidase [Pseudomonadales bacterium]
MYPAMKALMPALVPVLAAVLLSACSVLGPSGAPPAGPGVELATVPFIPQEQWQCGPAALATVLQASGLETSAAELVDAVWLPERQGAVTVELQAATRTAGRLAYRLDPDLDALLAELYAGRPVLVLQNLGIALYPSWHFAVVVGFDPEADELILRSGVTKRHRVRRRTFEATWARGERWAMVALAPGELPARVDRVRLLQAAADAERSGATGLALAAYAAWLERAPDDRAARFGRAAAQAKLAQLGAAAADYEALLRTRPSDIAVLNNLALVRARQGCIGIARRLIGVAVKAAEAPALRDELLRSVGEIEGMAGGVPSDACPVDDAGPADAGGTAEAVPPDGRIRSS